MDYCSDKLHEHFIGRINSQTLPQPPAPPLQIHGYNPQPPQGIVFDPSQPPPPPPIPPPPNPPRELVAPGGIETISGGSTPSGDMQYRKHNRSPSPDYERRRGDRDRHRDRRDRERRSRSRGRRHERRSRSREGDRRRERERKRSKSMSSVSSASSVSSSSEDSRRRHGHRSSRDSRRHKDYSDKPMAISSGSDSLEPPPLPPQIEGSMKTDFSHQGSSSSSQSAIRRHSNEVVPPPPLPPGQSAGSKAGAAPISKEAAAAAQIQKARNEKVSTPKRVYFAKPFTRPFKISELDPRPKPLPMKTEERVVLRGWSDIVPRRLSTENPAPVRRPNLNLPPLSISDDMRPRLSSSSSLNTPTPSSSGMNRVQERLEKLLKKDDPNKKSSQSALHIDTSIVTPTSSVPTPTSSRTEMLQHTLSAASLKSPSLLSPGSRRQSTSNIPTPSPISRQTSLTLGQPQLPSITSPISSASGLSTPKMSSGASPRSNLVTPTYQMSILKGAKVPSSNQPQSQSASVIKEKPTFPGIPKPNASAPGSKTNTPTTPYSGHKFAPTPTTPNKPPLPNVQKPKLSTPAPGLPLIGSKDQKPKTPTTTPDANKKIMEKKPSVASIPGTPPVSGSSTPKIAKPGEKDKDKDLAIANSWRERQQEKMKRDSAMAAALGATKKSKSEKALHQVQSGYVEKKKKKKSEQEEKTDITDEYMRALTSAGRKDSVLDKEKERERRKQEKKEAKRRARELEAKKDKVKKEKKKKKKHESEDSDSCDPIENSVRKRIGKEYKEYFQDIADGTIGLSMYDRVKRRTSGAKDDDAKRKQEALEFIKRKKEKEQKVICLMFVMLEYLS